VRAQGALLLLAALLAPAALSAAAALPPSPAAYGVQITKTWIPMRDGVRLAVTLYMPAGGKARERFPALFEYLPYRKDDDEVMRDFANHSYFARRGFVGARVDIRGFGNSEGAPPELGLAGHVPTFAPYARIIHVDIDPAEIGKNVAVEIPIVGDVKRVLIALLPQIQPVAPEQRQPR